MLNEFVKVHPEVALVLLSGAVILISALFTLIISLLKNTRDNDLGHLRDIINEIKGELGPFVNRVTSLEKKVEVFEIKIKDYVRRSIREQQTTNTLLKDHVESSKMTNDLLIKLNSDGLNRERRLTTVEQVVERRGLVRDVDSKS